MGPESAKSFPGQTLVETSGPAAGRARQEIDYGRRGKGYSSCLPPPPRGLTRLTSAAARLWVPSGEVELWLPAENERVYAILDN